MAHPLNLQLLKWNYFYPSRMSEPTVQEEHPLVSNNRSTESPPSHSSHSPLPSPPSQPAHNSDSDHTHPDSEDEGLLDASATGDEVTQLLRKTVEELELALDVKDKGLIFNRFPKKAGNIPTDVQLHYNYRLICVTDRNLVNCWESVMMRW